MNWLTMTDEEIMRIASPIMDNLMQASTDKDHQKHIKDFSENMKKIVTKENFLTQCEEYQLQLGLFTKRELVGVFKKQKDVRIFWKQWYSKSSDEYLAFLHLIKRDDKIEVINASVS